MKLKALIGVLAVAGLAMPGMASATNGYFSHGYGIKAKGMGGAGIALPQDSLAAATNPAGMVLVGSRMDLGVDWFRPVRGSTIEGNVFPGVNGTYSGNDKQDFFIPEFGYNKMIDDKMSAGVSVYGNGGMNSDYKNNPFAGFGATGSAGVNLEQLFIAPTFAMKLNQNNAVGVSLNLAYQRFSAKGLGPFTAASASPADVTNKGTDTSTGWGVRLGWTGQLTPDLTVGATYQSKTRMSKFDKYKGMFAEQGSFDIPENYGIGIAFKAAPKLIVAADVVQINYSDVPAIANPLSNLTVLGNLMGSNNGPGFGWKDMTVFKLGASYEVSKDMVVRAGYNHGKQPIPSSETFLNILAPGVVEDHVTLGATWTLANQSEVSVSYMHALKKTVNGSGSIPPGAPPGFGGGNANLNMYQDSLGVAYSWKM